MSIKDDVIAAITAHQIKIDRLEFLLTCEAVFVRVNSRLSVRIAKATALELLANDNPVEFNVLETLTGTDIELVFGE